MQNVCSHINTSDDKVDVDMDENNSDDEVVQKYSQNNNLSSPGNQNRSNKEEALKPYIL